jgi:acyl-CoA dehydrogenase
MCSDLIYAPSPTRDRITGEIASGCNHPGISLLNQCYAKVNELAPAMKRLREARKTPKDARATGIINDAEAEQIKEMNDLVARVIAVDDFAPDELTRYFRNYEPSAHDGAKPKSNPKEAAE